MKISYVRVSTLEQNLDRQLVIAKEMGAEKIYEEKASGKDRDRPILQQMMDELHTGDQVLVESCSRLARSTVDLLNIVAELNSKGVSLVSKKESFDTSTPQGKFVLTIFSALAELERATLLERQAEGIKSARLRGVHLGRSGSPPPALWFDLQPKVQRGEITREDLMERLGLSKNQYYYWIRRTGKRSVA